MIDVWALLLARADTREPEFSADELAALGSDAAEALVSAGMLRAIANATSVVCDACAGDHVEEVGFVESPPGTGLRAYIRCPEAGRVAVPLERLRRWEVDCPCLARLIAAALGVDGGVEQVVAGRVWLLGRATLGGRAQEIFFCRGLAWPDGAAVIGGAARLRASIRPMVLVPAVVPAPEIWGGLAPPALPISTLASWDGARVSLDRARVEDAVADGGRARTPPVATPADGAGTEKAARQKSTPASAWLTYDEARLILGLSRTRVADYVKDGALEHNGLARKKKRVSAGSVALLKLRLEKERLQERGRGVSEADREDQGPPMGVVPGRPTLDALAERASKGKNLK